MSCDLLEIFDKNIMPKIAKLIELVGQIEGWVLRVYRLVNVLFFLNHQGKVGL